MLFKVFVFGIFLGYLGILLYLLTRPLFSRVVPSATSHPSNHPQPSTSSPDPEVFLELVNVHKSFEHPILRGINLQIRRGETLGVLGRSGAGKSVLLKMIVGLIRPDRGLIFFEGRDISPMREEHLLEIRKRISYVFQGGAVFDFLNVRENIAYPLRERGIQDEEWLQKRIDYLLEAVEMSGMGDLGVDELSVGSKKQVAIARAIANEPDAILYDEPTTGLDPIIGKALSRLIRKLNVQEKLTSVVVTHDLRCLEIVADRLILLKDGVIHFQGTLEEFHNSSDPFVQAFIAGKRYQEPAERMSA